MCPEECKPLISSIQLVTTLAVATLCRKYAEKAIQMGNAFQAVPPLTAASEKACNNTSCLSAVRVDFLMVCLKANCYERASQHVLQ